ncbi:MAG: efflux RND transporter periplasmic adaptor subunit [Duncaniella sp.]|nr:efflux RND transporter periplasmic adaptor subunit [Duncaniella sp.]
MRSYNHRMKYFFVASILALSMTACHSHSESEHTEEADEHGHEHGADEIILEPDDAERLGVMVDTVRTAPFTETLKVSGEILPSSTDRGVVSAPTSGIVKLAAGINPGSQVSAGQSIATVTARNISGGDANQAAKVALDNAKRELDRVTPLLADGLVTRKEYNEALSAYESAKAAYSPAAASGVASAPRAGVITSINVGDGEYVETGQIIATVAANSTLTLRALVPSAQAGFLPRVSGAVMSFHNGNTVDITDYSGRLLSSAPASASETPGYVPVYFSFSGTAPVIPGNATEVYLKGAERADIISLPVEALVEQMGQKFVFIREGDHAYEKRPVSIGNSDGKRVEIKSGIEPGEIAVVKGSTFVRLAEQATVAPEGHSHNH